MRIFAQEALACPRERSRTATLAVGCLAAAGASSGVLSSVLFGVSPADPVGIGGAVSLVLGVALAAGIMAARPAMRADPSTTLRYE
ncbi:MAG: hypothetical protein JXB36_19775 [Gammaproteobacteria bacterium]|nr:hypothetical protein [Gammaproteobacteria bacterium]